MTGEPEKDRRQQQVEQFEQQASGTQVGLLAEFTDFLLHNKKWWLTPIILVLLFLGLMVVLLNTGAAPFIYTLF